MKESIYSIPISEAFEVYEGCPFCRIYSRLEQHLVEYITGPAMMEPDVRINTNEKGFCRNHYNMTILQKNRLSVALMLQTRLEWLLDDIYKGKGRGFSFKKEDNPKRDNCVICENIDREYKRVIGNAAVVWAKESEFKSLYARQEYICYPDYKKVTEVARKKLKGAELDAFLKITTALAAKRIKELKSDIDAFCNLYDYRSAGEAPDEKTAAAIENAVMYLTRTQER